MIAIAFENVPIHLFTASASPSTRREVIDVLGLGERQLQYFLSSFNRENIQYEVKKITPSKQKHFVLEICEMFRESSGIVYCNSKIKCGNMARYLRQAGIMALPYHTDMDSMNRDLTQDKWTNDKLECRVIVATVAFGMGFNKQDVKFVIHSGLPKSLERFNQGLLFIINTVVKQIFI